jgi:hypothetical protein
MVIWILRTFRTDPITARSLLKQLPRGMSASVKTALRWLRKWGFLLPPSTPPADSEKSVAESLPVAHAWVPPAVATGWVETKGSWMVVVARDGRGTERFLVVSAESPEDEAVQKAIIKLRHSTASPLP